MSTEGRDTKNRGSLSFELSLADGEIIVREGGRDRDMFIIQEGAVTISRTVGDKELILATLERGSFFGEMSLLEGLPRSATARAKGPTKLLVLRRGALLFKIRRDPTFALEMLHTMSRRLRYLDERITQLVAAGDVPSSEMKDAIADSEIDALKDQTGSVAPEKMRALLAEANAAARPTEPES